MLWSFFFCYFFFRMFFYFFLEVITHFFLSIFFCHLLLAVIFHRHWSYTTWTSSFFTRATICEFDFLFTVWRFNSWSIANFAFCFSSSWRTDCQTILSAVSEISSKLELSPAVPLKEFGGAVRKLFLFFLL